MARNVDSIIPDHTAVRPTVVSQRAVFLAALLPGALAIGISRILELSGAAFLIIAIALPAACMLIYFAANLRGDFFDSTRSQVADNIYFLGFLFFLVSLSSTLILFSMSEKIDQRIVVQGFGIALVTTILGLFLRIIVLQESAPIEESRERAERDLLDAILEFRTRISAGNEALQLAQDVAISGLAETSKLLVQRAAATSDDINQILVTATTSIEDRMKQIDIPVDVLTRSFRPLMGEFERAVGEIVQSTRDQAQAGRELAGNVRALATPIQDAAAAVEALNRAVATARPNVESIAASVSVAATATTEIAKSTEATRSSMQSIAGGVSNLHERIASLQIDARLEGAATQLAGIQEQLATLRNLTAGMVPAVRENLVNLPALIDKLNSVSGELQSAAVATRELVSNIERIQGPESIRQAMEAANTVIDNLRKLQDGTARQPMREIEMRVVQDPRGQQPTAVVAPRPTADAVSGGNPVGESIPPRRGVFGRFFDRM